MALFNKVDFIRAYCYKILPLVYEDTLSYYEVLCKMKSALNDVIENVNNLPEYIADLIEQFITSGAIDEVVRDILANYILNVKYPPKGITPAVGDGTADDSAAIQGCIDYASANGYGAVYFPYGKYLTSPISLKSNVGLYGFDRYSTSIICKGGASAPLFSGTVENVTIANLTLDGNDGFQVNDINLIDATVSNMLLTNLIFNDSNKHVVIIGNGGHLQVDNLVFNDCVVNALTVSGNIDVMANNMIVNSVSSVRGVSAVEIDSSGGTWEFISKATVPTGIVLSGSNNNVNATVINAIVPYTDTGANNNVVINGVSSVKHYTGNVTDTIGGNKSETIRGNVTRSVMQSVVNSITGNLTNTVGGILTETVTGNKVENITGDKHVIAANSTETISGDKTLTAGDITETATNYTSDIKGNSVINVAENLNFTAKNLHAVIQLPIKYGNLSKALLYSYIPFIDENNSNYEVIVNSNNSNYLIGYANVKAYGAVGDGITDDSDAFQRAFDSGYNVYVPSSMNEVYLLTKTINFTKRSQGLFGDIITHWSSTNNSPTPNSNVVSSANPAFYSPYMSARIKYITLTSKSYFDSASRSSTIGVKFDTQYNLGNGEYEIENCHFGGFNVALHTQGRSVKVTENLFNECTTCFECAYTTKGTTSITGEEEGFRAVIVENNRFHSVQYCVVPLTDYICELMIVGNNVDYGMVLIKEEFKANGLLITNNVCTNTTESPVLITSESKNILIANNQFRNTLRAPFYCLNFTGAIINGLCIQGNIFEGTTSSAIYNNGSAENVSLVSNVFKNVSQRNNAIDGCIIFNNWNKAVFTGNVFTLNDANLYAIRGYSANSTLLNSVVEGNAHDKNIIGNYTESATNHIQNY